MQMRDRGTRRRSHPAARRADDHGRPEPRVPDHGRVRRVDHRLVGGRALPARPAPRATRRCASCSTRRGRRASASCASRSARRTSPPAPHYTYDDMPAGQTDFALRALQHRPRPGADPAAAAPGASALNPQLTVMATPWSPPAWMKTNDSLVGGRLKDDPRDLPRLRALPGRSSSRRTRRPASGRLPHRAERAAEPHARAATPAPTMPVAQEAKVIEALGPMLRRGRPAHEDPRLRPQLGHPPRRHRHHPAGRGPGDRLPVPSCWTAAPARWVAGTAYHCYYGDPSAQTALHDAFPDKGIWFTECSGSHGPTDPPAQVFRDTLKWHARNIDDRHHPQLGEVGRQLEPRARPDRRPAQRRLRHLHRAGHRRPRTARSPPTPSTTRSATWRGSCSPARSASPARRSARPAGTARSWTSRSATPTARPRWSCTTRTTTRARSRSPRAAQSFDYTLPGGALATFTWPPQPALDDGCGCSTLDGATATRRAGRPTPRNAVDDDAATRGPPAPPRRPGQYLQVDLGRAPRRSAGSCSTAAPTAATTPRGWQLSASNDGGDWARAAAAGAGTGQLTTIDVPRTRGPLPAGGADRHRAAVVEGRRPAPLQLRRSS